MIVKVKYFVHYTSLPLKYSSLEQNELKKKSSKGMFKHTLTKQFHPTVEDDKKPHFQMTGSFLKLHQIYCCRLNISAICNICAMCIILC